MKDLKLEIELLPKGAWGNDFSRILFKKDWDILRNACYKKANHKCAICGYETDDLDAHEVWDFNTETKTQTLIDIIALCSRCHGVKHIRNSQRLGFGENAKKHFMKVNNCNELEFAAHLTKAQMDFEERNKIYRWKMIANLENFGGKGIKIQKNYVPLIKSEYTQTELNLLKNECNFTPRILEINIDNYAGTISISCDKTNKIEWYDDKFNLLATKFCFSEKFIAEFSVKNLRISYITFKLTGEYGEKVSRKFNLIPVFN
ncbi:MAG: hypothetical protein ACI4TZ_01310 [Christensenellales bacterium]